MWGNVQFWVWAYMGARFTTFGAGSVMKQENVDRTAHYLLLSLAFVLPYRAEDE